MDIKNLFLHKKEKLNKNKNMAEFNQISEYNTPSLYVDTSNEEKIELVYRGQENIATEKTVLMTARIFSPESQESFPLQKEHVEFLAHDLENKPVQVSVTVSELAKAIGVSDADITVAKQQQQLEAFIGENWHPLSVEEEELPPGITGEEIAVIKSYYEANRAALVEKSENIHIRKNEENGLPRSLVYIGKGSYQGLYILLKPNEEVKELGLGSENLVTYALELESRDLFAYRSGKREAVSDFELEVCQKVGQSPDHFMGGEPVYYKGPYRSRSRYGPGDAYTRKLDQDKSAIERQDNVDKVGLIMPFAWYGDLMIYADEGLGEEQLVKVVKGIVEGFVKLHDEHNIVHRDIKADNIMIDQEGKPKIADFGFARKVGEKVGAQGTAGYLPPEAADCVHNEQTYNADPSTDIWALGCLLSGLVYGNTWFDVNGQQRGNWSLMQTEQSVENMKATLFNSRENTSPLNDLIDSCLQFNPHDRASASKLLTMLESPL